MSGSQASQKSRTTWIVLYRTSLDLWEPGSGTNHRQYSNLTSSCGPPWLKLSEQQSERNIWHGQHYFKWDKVPCSQWQTTYMRYSTRPEDSIWRRKIWWASSSMGPTLWYFEMLMKKISHMQVLFWSSRYIISYVEVMYSSLWCGIYLGKS